MIVSLLLIVTLLPYLSLPVDVGLVNGTEARPHSRPHMVSIQRSNKHKCGGFLVSEQFVMTAAHCFTEYVFFVQLEFRCESESQTTAKGSSLGVTTFEMTHTMIVPNLVCT
ncbi:hypothetical protein PO909_027300 [Leuciscus waleckii]